VASEPDALLTVLTNPAYRFKRIGFGSWTAIAMVVQRARRTRLAGICVETRHMRAMLKAQINKTDRNDARGIAQMMRVGLRPVHVKTFPQSEAADAAPLAGIQRAPTRRPLFSIGGRLLFFHV